MVFPVLKVIWKDTVKTFPLFLFLKFVELKFEDILTGLMFIQA